MRSKRSNLAMKKGLFILSLSAMAILFQNFSEYSADVPQKELTSSQDTQLVSNASNTQHLKAGKLKPLL